MFFLFIYFSQAYCNILAGASMVIGLKFAGTANQSAFETLVSTYCDEIRVSTITFVPILFPVAINSIEEFEDIKGVIRICKSKKYRYHYGQKKKDKQ